MAPTRKRQTRRNSRKPRVLDVRSRGAVKAFENLIVQGPLTLVYVNAKWCGACHRFNKEVWSPLTKLKNKGMNLASVDSEMIGKTSLADVPRKFFPTLMLVGRDKKPAEFKDENGQPTNSMPRKESLEEDRKTLSALVQTPLNHPLNSATKPMATAETAETAETAAEPLEVSDVERSISNVPLSGSIKRQTMNSMPASPFEATLESEMPSIKSTGSVNKSSKTIKNRKTSVPDVASDLLATQTSSKTGTAAALANDRMRGGGLLSAIRQQVRSLDAVLGMRKNKKTRKAKA